MTTGIQWTAIETLPYAIQVFWRLPQTANWRLGVGACHRRWGAGFGHVGKVYFLALGEAPTYSQNNQNSSRFHFRMPTSYHLRALSCKKILFSLKAELSSLICVKSLPYFTYPRMGMSSQREPRTSSMTAEKRSQWHLEFAVYDNPP